MFVLPSPPLSSPSSHSGIRYPACPTQDPFGNLYKYEPNIEGFIQNWLVLGPFPNLGNACGLSNSPELGGKETDLSFNPIAGSSSSSNVWQLYRSSDSSGYSVCHQGANNGGAPCNEFFGIDLGCHFLGATQSSAYAFANVFSYESMSVELRVGSSDGVMVWLNGRIVANDSMTACRCWARDQLKVKVNILAGRNILLVKVRTACTLHSHFSPFSKLN
jgi:hypothetical protein